WSGQWFSDPKPRPPADDRPGIGSEPTVGLPSRGAQGSNAAAGNWPQQPQQPPPGGGAAPRSRQAPGSVPAYRGGGKRRLRPGRIVKIVALLVVVVLVVAIGMYFYLDSKLTRANVLVDYA